MCLGPFKIINEKVTSRFWFYGCVTEGEVWTLGNYFISGDYLFFSLLVYR